jgi:multiple sugar transport system permease protein
VNKRTHNWRLVALVAAVMLAVFPFYAMVVLSLKPGQSLAFPEGLFPWPLSLDSYEAVLGGGRIGRWLLNTTIYSVISTAIVLLISAMAAYAFARRRFPGSSIVFWIIIAMMMVPYHVTLIPTFMLVAELGGVNQYWGLIVPTLANAQAIFLMRQFITGLPDELFEAARIDGAGEWRVFTTLVLPLCKPIITTLGIFVFLWHWNDYLWPLIIAKSDAMRTLTVGLASMQQEVAPLSVLLAGATLSFLPIFIAYLFAQRTFRQGSSMAGIKG